MMPIPAQPSRQIRLGEFQFDRQSGELRSTGRKSTLQEKPFQVLVALLERPGELVTRQQLKERLWPSDTFVDFDHGVNKAVNRLREALHDSADHPKYVETLARRGYRLMVPVEAVEPAVAQSTWSDIPAEPPGDTRPTAKDVNAAQLRRSRRPLWPAILLVSAVILSSFGLFLGRWRTATKTVAFSPIHSVAVLPLENLSADPTQDYFADGMTDVLITDLGQMSTIKVISRTSAMQYKGIHRSLPQIARELRVDAVVEGTVLRSGDQVRITAQLIDARTDQHLWAQSYAGDLRDVLKLQSEVADSIADHIQSTLTRFGASATGKAAPNPAAQDAYLRGHYFAQKGTIQDLQKAVTYFREAIEIDPGQAPSHAGLATAYVQLGHILYLGPKESFPLAKVAALKALELDENSEEAHTTLANIKFLYEWDFPGAEREFRSAIRLNPNSVHAQSSYSSYLNAMGHSEEAVTRIEQAAQIDPLSTAALADVAWQLYWARRYDDAIAQARKVVEMDPSYYPSHVCLGLAYEQKLEFAAAIAELKSATGFCRDQCFGLIGQVSALSGDRTGALEALRKLRQRSYVSPWLVSIVYAELGDRDRAFFWLEKAYEGREHDLAFSNVWPMFDKFRSDPRFQDLMRRIGLQEGT
jgi:TolB-like protein/DNA-binding winged helix-turn-helix (wHTH) protein/Tfp pilus assembly protein PilF